MPMVDTAKMAAVMQVTTMILAVASLLHWDSLHLLSVLEIMTALHPMKKMMKTTMPIFSITKLRVLHQSPKSSNLPI